MTYLINLLPILTLNGKSPCELLFKEKPRYEHLRVFRWLCYVFTKLKPLDKFSTRARKCVFLWYISRKKRYKVLELDSNKVYELKDMVFYEEIFPLQIKESRLNFIPIQDHEKYKTTNKILGTSPWNRRGFLTRNH